ncbi:MAG: hypothetical protein U9Q03_00285 [Patescibacteria group bacterium]|nr:hypothetical protein [Patescibacteria group bacterium]
MSGLECWHFSKRPNTKQPPFGGCFDVVDLTPENFKQIEEDIKELALLGKDN